MVELGHRLKVNLSGVPMVGDSIRDLEAAQAVRALPVLVRTGKGKLAESRLARHDSLNDAAVYDDLAAFTTGFLRDSRQR